MSLDIDGRWEQKKLELYKKHGLDGSMSDEEVANKIRCWGRQAIIGLADLLLYSQTAIQYMQSLSQSKISPFVIAEK